MPIRCSRELLHRAFVEIGKRTGYLALGDEPANSERAIEKFTERLADRARCFPWKAPKPGDQASHGKIFDAV